MEIVKPTPNCEEDKAYLKYIDEHRSNVINAFRRHGQRICLNLALIGTPTYFKLRNRILAHDASKYGPEEFEAYRNMFYPKKDEEKDEEKFRKAWRHHYTTNDHHWEYWLTDGKPKEMSRFAIAEMILDWEAMSVKFKNSPVDWYKEHKDTIILERHTRELVEKTLASLQASREYPYTIRQNNRRGRRQKK